VNQSLKYVRRCWLRITQYSYAKKLFYQIQDFLCQTLSSKAKGRQKNIAQHLYRAYELSQRFSLNRITTDNSICLIPSQIVTNRQMQNFDPFFISSETALTADLLNSG
jgi:hypothetical protein